jgi:hypothetical protein
MNSSKAEGAEDKPECISHFIHVRIFLTGDVLPDLELDCRITTPQC